MWGKESRGIYCGENVRKRSFNVLRLPLAIPQTQMSLSDGRDMTANLSVIRIFKKISSVRGPKGHCICNLCSLCALPHLWITPLMRTKMWGRDWESRRCRPGPPTLSGRICFTRLLQMSNTQMTHTRYPSSLLRVLFPSRCGAASRASSHAKYVSCSEGQGDCAAWPDNSWNKSHQRKTTGGPLYIVEVHL